MRATILRNKALVVEDMPMPEPEVVRFSSELSLVVSVVAISMLPSMPTNSLTLFVARMHLSIWIPPVT